MLNKFKDFIANYEAKVIPIYKQTNEAYFNATISGNNEDFNLASELQFELNKIYTNKDDFNLICELKESEEITNPEDKRQILDIYNEYVGNQFDVSLLEKIVDLSTKIEKRFSTFRPKVDNEELTDNQIDEILKTSTDSKYLENVWRTSKLVGKEVYEDVITLVKLRNEAAKNIGYDNFHDMSLLVSEQDSETLDLVFDELDELTSNAYKQLKIEIDEFLANRYSVPINELKPWHYQDKFFQHGPNIFETNFDDYFENKDLVDLTKKYFKSIDLEIDDLISNSDLFEKPNKYQHAYCVHVDRLGDVRVLCNVKQNHKWMSTLLHEFGHAVYDKNISQKLPWQLRKPAHTFTTESIAMMFGRMASDSKWLLDNEIISKADEDKVKTDCFNSLRLEQLVFSRWVQVMYRFERQLYLNPDQNLNDVWWSLVEKYQLLKRPEQKNDYDWSSKIHLALYPSYYHNYMLGELLASQLYQYIITKVIENNCTHSFTNCKEVGQFLKEAMFKFGALHNWSDLVEKVTEESLSARHYANQFVNLT